MYLLLTEPRSWFMLRLPQFFLQTCFSSDRKSSLEEFINYSYLLLVNFMSVALNISTYTWRFSIQRFSLYIKYNIVERRRKKNPQVKKNAMTTLFLPKFSSVSHFSCSCPRRSYGLWQKNHQNQTKPLSTTCHTRCLRKDFL